MKMGPLDQDTLEDIRYNAEFVESVINKALGKKAGYSMEGVTWLDDFLQRQHEQGDKSYVDRVVSVYGSYLGECITRNVGGQWVELDGTHAIAFDETNGTFPFNKVHKHLKNGREGGDSVLGYYDSVSVLFQSFAPPAKMDMNDQAQMYLNAFFTKAEIPGGLSFSTALGQSNLDGSLESLDRVDHLLDQIRIKFKPDFDSFLDKHANQNFLYLLAFYMGHVITRSTGGAVKWLSYEDMLREIPDNRAMFPECFQTSVTCITPAMFFVPLYSITSRLFDEVTTKSVRMSAELNIRGGDNV
ncbi:hypothetical protein [Pseudoduganella sp. R-34]|uniref:hypothetical protein n=1 Tax=Pseudoduganella sp. R-34 TaxID=3404062 RepID=UPI003CF16A2C